MDMEGKCFPEVSVHGRNMSFRMKVGMEMEWKYLQEIRVREHGSKIS